MTKKNGLFAVGETVANMVLGGGGFVFLLVLLYFLYHYRWTGAREFTSSMGPVLYYVFPAVLTSLLFACLRLQSSQKINLALVFLSGSVAIYTGELFLRVVESMRSKADQTIWANYNVKSEKEKKEIVELAKKFGVNFDIRTRLEVIYDLRKRGINAVPDIAPLVLLKEQADGTMKSQITIDGKEVLPLSGIGNSVTVFCNENGEFILYNSDEHGFHNPEGIWGLGRLDIAAVGDSFTHGACVPSDENFVALIRKRYPKTLNLGMSSMGPLTMLGAVKEYLQFFRPKVVLWFYYEGNDLFDLSIERKSHLLMNYLRENFNQGLFSRKTKIDRAVAAFVEKARDAAVHKEYDDEPYRDRRAWLKRLLPIIRLTILRQRLGLVYGTAANNRGDPSARPEDETTNDVDLLRNVLLQTKAFVSAWGGELYFVYLPARSRYAGVEISNKYRETILELARTIGLPVIDIDRAFQTHSDPLDLFPFRRFGHYNEAGHQLVGEEVLRSISLGDR